MIHFVILAGGKGERFWPLSGTDRPKPFWKWGKGPTFFQLAVERAESLSKRKWNGHKSQKSRIWIVTESRYQQWVDSQAPHVPRRQVLLEPVGRNTAAAIGWGAKTILQEDPEAIMVCFPSDHWIHPIASLAKALKVAVDHVTENDTLGFLGICPSFPATGLGYVQLGSKPKSYHCYPVVRFHEKPSLEKAKQWIRSGKYLWNSGIFIWRASHLVKELERWLPDLIQNLTPEKYDRIYPVSIDFGVLEKTKTPLFCVPVPIEWNDLGTWENVWNFLPKDENGNVLMEGDWQGRETRDSLIYSTGSLPIRTLGVSNLILVQTDQGTLVCHREKAQEVRKLISNEDPRA